MTARITGSLLRDLVVCERRVHHDLSTPANARDPVSSFVAMLWSGGRIHEDAVLSGLSGKVVDLRKVPVETLSDAMADALAGSADWIVGAHLEYGDRLGLPDLLHRVDGTWCVGDVKSGTPFADDGLSPKREYVVQIGHYAALLGDLGLGAADRAFVIGRDGEIAWFDLYQAVRPGVAAPAARAAELVELARAIRDGVVSATAALSSTCGLCHWRSLCRQELEDGGDLTLVAGLGRSTRTAVGTVARTVTELAALPDDVPSVRGVGPVRLARFRDRARLLSTPGATPYATEALGVVRHDRELHFDLEADPLRGIVYLHGILVRERTAGGDCEQFVHFFADDDAGERDTFAAAFEFLTADAAAHIFYYSKFERTSYRALQRRYPTVCSAEDVERLFSPERATDLYFDVVAPKTEWPLSSYGIKPIAKFLGFGWSDPDASGAASIGWYDEYRRTGDPAVRDRILRYNHDDCAATAVLLDALVDMPVSGPPPRPTVPLTVPGSGD